MSVTGVCVWEVPEVDIMIVRLETDEEDPLPPESWRALWLDIVQISVRIGMLPWHQRRDLVARLRKDANTEGCREPAFLEGVAAQIEGDLDVDESFDGTDPCVVDTAGETVTEYPRLAP